MEKKVIQIALRKGGEWWTENKNKKQKELYILSIYNVHII